MNILQVNASARSYANNAGSFSTRLANELVQKLLEENPGAKLTVRDLTQAPHPILDEVALNALFTPVEQRTSEQTARVALSDALVTELFAADIIVLGVPMYNFGVSVQFKAWIDAICRAGSTFRYTEKGPVGLVEGKSVYAVLTSGGIHRNQPTDLITPYLKTVLGFLGMTNIEFIYAEGLALGPEAESRALADAQDQISRSLQKAEAA